MRMLLTSAGMTNPSITDALVGLLGRPVDRCRALCVPTAAYAHPMAGPGRAWDFVAGREPRTPMCELGWGWLGVLELTALPSLGEDVWVPWVREADVLLVGGGNTLYLCRWLVESGLADLLPTLDAVWVGVSAGSVALTPKVGAELVVGPVTPEGDAALGLVDFCLFPHLDHPELPAHSTAHAEDWATRLPVPGYAIDDATAVRVVDGTVDVVSEGSWRLFPATAG